MSNLRRRAGQPASKVVPLERIDHAQFSEHLSKKLAGGAKWATAIYLDTDDRYKICMTEGGNRCEAIGALEMIKLFLLDGIDELEGDDADRF